MLKIEVLHIVSIDRTQRCYFLSCLCGTPISHVADSYYCPSCGLECVNAIPSYRLKILVSHLNGNNIFILDDPEASQIVGMECSDLLQEKPNEPIHDFIVPDFLSLKIIGREFVFIVDLRPIGYEFNISVHFVRAITDDPSIKKIFQDASNINQEKLVPLNQCVSHMPLESKYNLTIVSEGTSDSPSTSRLPVHHVSPKSDLHLTDSGPDEPQYRNTNFKASSSHPECPQILTIGEELQAQFGKGTKDGPLEQMDEISA
ncbi:hypothetical protein PIB30_001432 [Stylosanthes scabra]|uniref:Replication factor A C-terminal domain-containing protein n=1 Tax=Stylosanthes scabra TaxID=79078 RepID=A0ABU6YZR2_9FABA|nr:hypothetical protein [Stylosanthes scabra]